MIIVDSNTWADFFNGVRTPHVARLDAALEGEHVRAASLFRALRRRGVTVRGAVDGVIAQTCLDAGAEFLSPDTDFEGIARYTALRLWHA